MVNTKDIPVLHMSERRLRKGKWLFGVTEGNRFWEFCSPQPQFPPLHSTWRDALMEEGGARFSAATTLPMSSVSGATLALVLIS